MLVFVEGGKPEYLEKNLSEQGQEPMHFDALTNGIPPIH